MTRPVSPGEDVSPRQKAHDDAAKRSRIHSGVVEHVDPDGWMSVNLPALNQPIRVRIPGFVSPKGFDSAWFRFVPHKGSHATVGFGPDNTPELVGIPNYERSPKSTLGHKHIFEARTANLTTAGLRMFEPLKQGEWDLKSGGGAYLRGSSQGALTLAGGGTQSIILSKPREEIVTEAPSIQWKSGSCELRFGAVKRPDPILQVLIPPGGGDAPAKVVGFPPASSPVEWQLKIGTPLLPVPIPPDILTPDIVPGTLYQEKIGVVRGDSSISGFLPSTMLATGQALRIQKIAYGLGLEALRMEVDIQGNVQITHGITPGAQVLPPAAFAPSHGLVLSGQFKALRAEYGIIGLSSSSAVPMFVDVLAPPSLVSGVYLGGVNAAAEPVPKGRTLYGLFVALIAALNLITPGAATTGGAPAASAFQSALETAKSNLFSLNVGVV